MTTEPTRDVLEELLRSAVKRVHPSNCLAAHLPEPPDSGRIIAVGAGKAAAAMAGALEQVWAHQPLEGLVICPYGSKLGTKHIKVIEAGHPIADENGVRATQRIVEFAKSAKQDDLVLALLSGGGSALLTLPRDGLNLSEYQAVIKALLASGARIQDINLVRRHLSAVKGGRLAKMIKPARLVTLAISDVVGDAPEVIASGPTVPDRTQAAEAIAILNQFNIPVPLVLKNALKQKRDRERAMQHPDYRLIAKPLDALQAAAERAAQIGLSCDILGDTMEGDAQEAGRILAAEAIRRAGQGWRGVLLSGGEVTTQLKTPANSAEGGPNREAALSFAMQIAGQSGLTALFADTDGVDGKTKPTDPIAGAYADGLTMDAGLKTGRNAQEDLRNHRSGDFFERIGQSIRTGPTQTNVNDFRAIGIGQRKS